MQIVLVDPDPTSAAALRYLLSEAGHDVTLAGTSSDACHLAMIIDPDSVLVSTAARQIDMRSLRDDLRRLGYAGAILAVQPPGRESTAS